MAIVCSPPYCATGQDFDAYLALDPQDTLGMRGRVEEHMALCGPSGGAAAAETSEPEEAVISKRATTGASKPQKKKKGPAKPKKPEPVSVIDGKRSNNCRIALSRVKMPFDELMKAPAGS